MPQTLKAHCFWLRAPLKQFWLMAEAGFGNGRSGAMPESRGAPASFAPRPRRRIRARAP